MVKLSATKGRTVNIGGVVIKFIPGYDIIRAGKVRRYDLTLYFYDGGHAWNTPKKEQIGNNVTEFYVVLRKKQKTSKSRRAKGVSISCLL